MARARIDVEVVQAQVAERRLAQIARAEQRLNVQFKGGFITSEQLRKSTDRLNRARALLTRRLNTNSASMRRANRAAATMTTTLGSLRSIALGVGVSFGAWQVARIIGDTLRVVADFEAAMNRVRALTGATRGEFALLEEQAKTLGRTTRFSAREAAGGMAFLAQAGFQTNQIIGAMPATLKLAAAAQLDLASSADIVSNVMAGFGIDTEDLGSAVDVLTKAFTSANTDLLQLGQAMKLAGPVAKQFGLTFEETTAAIALMGNAGFQSTLAGTALRGALIRLAASAKKFGVDVFNARGKLLPLVEIMRRLQAAGLSDTEMFELLGQRAGPAFAALLGQGVGKLQELTTELENSGGTAERIANIQMEGLKGATIELTSAWEGLKLALNIESSAETVVDSLTKITRAVTSLFESDVVKLTFSRLGNLLGGYNSSLRALAKNTNVMTFEFGKFEEVAENLAKAQEEAAGAAGGHTKALEKQEIVTAQIVNNLDALIQATGRRPSLLRPGEQAELERFKDTLDGVVASAENATDFLDAIQENRQFLEGLEQAEEAERLLTEQAKEMQRAHEQAFRRMEAAVDSFFTQTFLGARSLSDVWNSLTQQMLRVFLSTVAKMVAGWLLGMRQMQAASAGGGGGGIGSILGGIFGGGSIFGSATAPGGTGTFSGAPIGSSLISGGGGLASKGLADIGIATGLPPSSAGSATGIAAQETLLAKLGINLRGIGPISGELLASGGILATLSALQSSSPLRGALLGAGGGALLGFAFGGPIGAAIGAVVGAISGLISGIFGRGKLKRRAAASEEMLTAQLGEVIAEFKTFQTDLEGALATIDQLFESFQGQVKPLGKAGRNAVKNISPLVFAVKNRLTEIQAARDARLLLSASSLIPEFAHGGLVPSLLHPGEFVIRREAVQQVGVQNLERINRGEAAPGNVTIGPIHVHAAPGMDERALAAFTLRTIRRAARDRGLRPPA